MDIPSYLIGAIKGAGSAGVKYVVVQTLPSTGEEGTIYLVPKSTSKTNNVYDEYMYISNNWELIGNTEADLSNYQEKLVSGTNIKTINNESILGSGNIDISSGGSDANVYYLGKTDSYNTEQTALDLNSLKIGRYYLKHASSNNTLWIKATYKGSGAEPTTRTLQITLFDDFSSTNPKKPVVVQNTIILYIDKEFTEDTTSLTNLGSLTACYKDDNNGFINYFTMIHLNSNAIALGTNNKEKFNLTSQYSTMPTATSGTVGKIVQYTGTTDSTYTNGYFYKCVSDGQSTPTYSWEQLDVQPSSGGSGNSYIININQSGQNITNYNTTENKAVFKEIYDNINTVKPSDIYVYINNISCKFNIEKFKYDQYSIILYCTYLVGQDPTTKNGINYTNKNFLNLTANISNGNISSITYNKDTISYYSINYDDKNLPTTKKYVDDKPTTYTGYDATKTQVLKNVNGVIQWVDE